MELFKIGFVSIRLADLIDVGITTVIIYNLYQIMRGTLAIRVISVLMSIFLMWKIVDLMDLRLLKSVLDQFFNIGAVAIVIIFAPEIRKYLSVISKNTIVDRIIRQVYTRSDQDDTAYREIISALKDLRATGNGALIVMMGNNSLTDIRESGEQIDANVNSRLIHSLFQKESPLHDGAMLIEHDKIIAVRCILPISDSQSIPSELGTRHRAALGVSETSDVLVIVLSEERREISLASQGKLRRNVEYQEVKQAIRSHHQIILN
ncbi:MAG: diadenylate cyclase CdaA [Bacteroidota bacterium]